MKNQIFKLFCAIALVMSVNVAFANGMINKSQPSKTFYKRNNSGFNVINHTGTTFTSVTISGLDENNVSWTLTSYDIPDDGSDYIDFGFPIHSVSVTINTSASVVYAFDVWNATTKLYDTINYNGTPRTFYIPDNDNTELTLECYSEDY